MFNWSSTRDVLQFTKEDIQSSSFLFKEQLDKVEQLVQQFDAEKNANYDTNKVISIVGEIGTGKSTFLNVLDTYLKAKDYLVLERVDPSIFDDSLSIMELFVARVYETISDPTKDNHDMIKRTQTVDVIRQINEITKLIISLKNKDVFYKENSTNDVIQDILGKIDFTKKIKKLVSDTLDLMSTFNKRCRNLVLIVDDLDLVNNKTTYQMLDYIQKYLATNIIVIVAYRNKQLFNAVVSETINDNRDLVSQEWVNQTELELQSSRFIEKLLPLNSRVHLFSGEELLKQNVTKVLAPFITNEDEVNKVIKNLAQQTTLKQYDENSLKAFIDGLVYNRTRIKLFPYDSTELNPLVIPSNLRGIIFMLEYFIELNNPNESYYFVESNQIIDDFLKRNNIKVQQKNNTFFSDVGGEAVSRRVLKAITIAENVHKYKAYLRMKTAEEMSSLHIKFLEELSERPVEVKNHFALNFMLDRVNTLNLDENKDKDKEIISEIGRLKRKTSNNITLGDVWEAIDILKSVGNESEMIKLIYSLKQYYSVELISNYFNFALLELLESHPESNQSLSSVFLDNYSTMIMRKFLPDTFEVYESQEEEDLNFKNLVYSNRSNESYDFDKSIDLALINTQDESILNSENKRMDILASIHNFVRKVAYLQYPSKGHVYNSTHGNLNKRLSSFRYRDVYYLGRNIHEVMRSNTNYRADPFVIFTNYDYLMHSVSENKYVFLSMFDIDVFYRNNYYSVKTSRFAYLLRAINRVVEETREKTQSVLNNPWTGFASNNHDCLPPFCENDLLEATLFETYVLSLDANDKRTQPIDHIIREGTSFKGYSFVQQMIILEEFFKDPSNQKNERFSELYKFFKNNNNKRYVAKENAIYYRSLISNQYIADHIETFLEEL